MSATRLMMLGCPDVLAARIDAQITAQASDADELVASGLHPVTAAEVARCINSLTNDSRPLIALGVQPHLANEIVKLTAEGAGLVFDNDFTQGYLDPRITHTRPGKSWDIVNGVLREYDVNEPVLTPDGWSLRPAETNLVWPSVPASGTWGAINATWGDTVEAAGYTLRRVNVGAAGTGAAKYITRTNMSAAAGEIVLLALVVLPNAGNSTLGLSFTGFGAWEGGGGAAADFDLLAGTSSWVGGPGVAKGMQQLEDGAWLCWTVGKKKSDTSDTSLSPAITVWPTGTASSGTEHLHVGGVHVVKGFTAPIPYIPTTDSAVTRPADDASIQGDAFAQVFNPLEGAIVWEGRGEAFSNFPDIFRIYKSGSAEVFLYQDVAQRYVLRVPGHANQLLGVVGTDHKKIAFVWSGLSAAVFSGGQIVWEKEMTSTLDGVDSMRMFLSGGIGVRNVGRLTIFNRRPSDEQMEALTS